MPLRDEGRLATFHVDCRGAYESTHLEWSLLSCLLNAEIQLFKSQGQNLNHQDQHFLAYLVA